MIRNAWRGFWGTLGCPASYSPAPRPTPPPADTAPVPPYPHHFPRSASLNPAADQIIQAKQEASMREGVAQTGLPAMRNFQEKKMLKMLYELRDQEGLVCYAYLVNQLNGTVGQFLGKCIGYGLPASTQYSNPEKMAHQNNYNGGSFGTLPQAEPNGLFMPEGLSATWLMMVDPSTGDPRPVYVEPLIIVSPFKLH